MMAMLKHVVHEMHFLEPNRLRLHDIRNTLLNNGLPMSLVAFAGLWKLQPSIYRYFVHLQQDLLQIVHVYLYGPKTRCI